MSIMINVLLTGVCYIATTGNTPNVVSIVMPDASMARAAKAKDGNGQHPIIPEHRAFIAVRHDQIKPNGDHTDITGSEHFRTYIDNVDMDVYLLSHEQITLLYSLYNAQPTLAFGSGDGSQPSDPPDSKKRFDVTTLVDLRREACNRCALLPAEFVKVTAATIDKIAARLDINDGVVSAAYIDPNRTWAFAKNGPERSLPQEAAVDIATTDGKLTIRLDKLTTTNAPGKLELDGNGYSLTVIIGNTTIANIVGAASPMDLDVHFEHYYDLLPSSFGQHIPHAVRKHPGGANCPPATISY